MRWVTSPNFANYVHAPAPHIMLRTGWKFGELPIHVWSAFGLSISTRLEQSVLRPSLAKGRPVNWYRSWLSCWHKGKWNVRAPKQEPGHNSTCRRFQKLTVSMSNICLHVLSCEVGLRAQKPPAYLIVLNARSSYEWCELWNLIALFRIFSKSLTCYFVEQRRI